MSFRKQGSLFVPTRNILVPRNWTLRDNRGFIAPGIIGGIAAARRRTAGGDYTTGMILWLKAANIAGSNDDAIATWTDASGFGNNATQSVAGNKPLLKTGANGIGGVNALGFINTNATQLDLAGVAPGSGSFTIIAVFQPGTSDPYAQILTQGTTRGLYTSVTGGNRKGDYYDGSDRYFSSILSNGTNYILTVVASGSGVALYKNGLADGTATFTVTAPTFNAIGASGSSERFGGLISEIRVWPSALSATNRESAEDAMGALYGITVTH